MSSLSETPLPTVCILAGGLGTRLGSLTKTIPKPLIRIAGEPFLVHQLRVLAEYGAKKAVLCVGHLGTLIERELGAEVEGVELLYSYDSPNLDGTLGAVRRALPLLGHRFLVLYGDTFLDINYQDVVQQWNASGALAIMTVLRNENRWGPSNATFDHGFVTRYDKFHIDKSMQWIDYGLGGLSIDAIDAVAPDCSDLADLYRVLASQGKLRGYPAANRFHEIGTPQSLRDTEDFLRARAAR